MFGEQGDEGYLRVGNEADRIEIASILCKNGYTVSIKRKKRNGKTYEYYVYYKMEDSEVKE